MQRTLFGGLLAAVCVFFPVGAGSLETSAGLRAQPMQFDWQRQRASDRCGNDCRSLVFASGMITADTPRRFEIFAGKHDIEGATIVLDSDGGSVRGALALGRLIRQFGLSTTVGRRSGRGSTGAARGLSVSPASCESMCAFVMLGGVHRDVPPDSRVLVHQIWLGDRRDDAVAASYTAEDLVLVQRDIGHIVRYTADMGGGLELIELALRIPPWEPMRVLSREELKRAGLALGAEQGEPSTQAVLTPVSTGWEDRGGRAKDRGWSLVEGLGAAPMLARRHPLTYEGERIGSFDLILGCGDVAGRYALTYVERRTERNGAARSPVVDQVRLWIGKSNLTMRIRSSKAKRGRGHVETVATTALSSPLVRGLAGAKSRFVAVRARSAGQPATMIRVGNSGFAEHFGEFEAVCRDQSRPRLNAHAQLDQ